MEIKTNPKEPVRRITFWGIVFALSSIYLWLDYLYGFGTNNHSIVTLLLAIVVTSLSISHFLMLLPQNALFRIARSIVALPLAPFYVIAVLSQTRLIASLTLPVTVLCSLVVVSTFVFHQLEVLRLGDNFNSQVIPFLNLTTITIVFAYGDRHLAKLLARIIPENQMPRTVIQTTDALLQKKYFIKIAYLVLTALLVMATIERLSGLQLVPIPYNYKSIVLESLLTLIAVDQVVLRWKE